MARGRRFALFLPWFGFLGWVRSANKRSATAPASPSRFTATDEWAAVPFDRTELFFRVGFLALAAASFSRANTISTTSSTTGMSRSTLRCLLLLLFVGFTQMFYQGPGTKRSLVLSEPLVAIEISYPHSALVRLYLLVRRLAGKGKAIEGGAVHPYARLLIEIRFAHGPQQAYRVPVLNR